MKAISIAGTALLALAAAPAWAQGPVSGQVRSGERVAGETQVSYIPGATILLDGQAVGQTDQNGRFTLPAVAAGQHQLRITALGYQAFDAVITGQASPQERGYVLQTTSLVTSEAIVTATRASDRTGTVYTDLMRRDLNKRNFGQDLPYLLDQTPSAVVASDAGAGVGYTNLRIRGVDGTGINTTINGIPLNDPESHGSFLVNLPDLASSINSIQVQRGVGTSQNGSAAFGASLNISTLDNRREAYGETQNSYGSFNTWKNNVSFGTGLVGKYFTFDGRLSRIRSDGYMNRAFSDLKSYYFAAGFQAKSTLLKFITFSGVEKTYQAWNGVPEPAITGDAALLKVFVDNGELSAADAARVVQEGRRYSYYTYDNQTDNYQQNHYQLHLSQGLGADWSLAAALHLTRGFGYYESFRANRRFSTYGLPNVVIGNTTLTRTDLVDRKWLDNYFYGGTFALTYQPRANERLQATLGGGWNQFDNDHYGEIIWAQYASTSSIRQHYYDNTGRKTDYNAYLRATYQALPRLGLYADAQVRRIGYVITGNEVPGGSSPAIALSTDVSYTFFNPKAGATFDLGRGHQLYGSFAVGQREPVRSDFTDRPAGDGGPHPERLNDLEAGYRFRNYGLHFLGEGTALRLEVNYFSMTYVNQLVNTGQLNDVGTALRTNAPDSYRRGVEVTGYLAAADKISLTSSLTLSRNRILNYRNVTYDENYNTVVDPVGRDVAISYAPGVVSGHTLEGQPLRGLRLALLYKTVSRQYLDNTGSDSRSLVGYQTLDFRARYAFHPGFVQEIELAALVSNLLNERYAANGYTYGYVGASGNPETFNWYYPQALRNYLLSVNVRF